MDTNNSTPSEKFSRILAHLQGVQKRGDSFQACCPAHQDHKQSLSLKSEGGKVLLHCHAGCPTENIIAALGLKWEDLFDAPASEVPRNRRDKPEIVKIYDYFDQGGSLLFQTVRFFPKDFRQRRPDGRGGWIYNLKGVTPVIYRLPQVQQAATVFIVEGEKDADNLAQLGLIGTTNAMGAGKWKSQYNEFLREKKVAIIPDNDDVGRKHAESIANGLLGVAEAVKIINLPNLKPKGDVSDWLANGGSKELLLELLTKTAPFTQVDRPVEIESDPEEKETKETQAQQLIKMAADTKLFHSPDDGRFAINRQDGHSEVWEIRSKGFRDWLNHQFYRKTGKPPGAQALQDAIRLLEAKARYDGEQHPTFVRIGEYGPNVYLDLCNPSWEVVEITAAGWRIISDPSVKFRRTRGMLSLPHPIRGGNLKELQSFLNLPDDRAFHLICAFLVQAFRPCGPYPILNLEGEQGSGKSQTAKMLRSILDPNTAMLRTGPRDERDLMIAATNSWLLTFDNLSGIPEWLSDALCRLSTGGGFSTRGLYTDSEEVIFDATRPIILTGIDRISSRHDLIDRGIITCLPPIPEDKRHPEAELWKNFDAARPRVLGCLCDAVSTALSNINNTRLDRLPRMADFALWVTRRPNQRCLGNRGVSWKHMPGTAKKPWSLLSMMTWLPRQSGSLWQAEQSGTARRTNFSKGSIEWLKTNIGRKRVGRRSPIRSRGGSAGLRHS